MSTAPPTTLAPTTLGPTTAVPDTDILCTPLYIWVRHDARLYLAPGHGRDSSLDRWYTVNPIVITLGVEGENQDLGLVVDPILAGVTILGEFVPGVGVDCDPINISIVPRSSISYGVTGGGEGDEEGGFTVESSRCNWVKWSKIGCLDFTIDESNVAGERPLDWHGCVYEIIQLNDTAVVYGENGVTILKPANIAWGMQTIHRLGILHKASVAGTQFEHYFIDATHRLYKLSSEGLQLLDYQEFLELMTNPKLSLDPETGLLYICDGTYGYVYSTRSNSFGVGPVNVSGVGSQSGTLMVVGDGTIEVPKFDICTDIYDFGTRKPKTIEQIEFGTDLRYKLYAMVESKISNRGSFMKSRWALVNPSGIAYIPCYGVEFKFNLRSYIYEYLELDYIKVTGVIHGFSYLESIE